MQPRVSRRWAVTAIPLGRLSPERLNATYPHTPRARSSCAYLVLLRVEIARFTSDGLCPPEVQLSWCFRTSVCFRKRDRLSPALR